MGTSERWSRTAGRRQVGQNRWYRTGGLDRRDRTRQPEDTVRIIQPGKKAEDRIARKRQQRQENSR